MDSKFQPKLQYSAVKIGGIIVYEPDIYGATRPI